MVKTGVVKGDCKDQLKLFDENSIDMIYLDPPFFTQRKQKLSNKDREFEFSDIWKNNEDYFIFLYERLIEMKRVLKDSGSIFFHCDKNASHMARFALDRVFGQENFQSEIIWTYKRWSNSKKGLLPTHQNIFFYSKSKNFKFNKMYQDYSESTNIDQILQKRTRNESNKTIYAKNGDGTVISSGEKKGVPLNDVWDIPYLNPKAKERVGYPTQKPILLLERIIEISTDEKDLVLDPFCGSGTTLAAAKLLNRYSIGIDISTEAVALTEERLKKIVKTDSHLLRKGRSAYKHPDEYLLSILNGVDFIPVNRNKGIDAILKKHFHGKVVPVKIQKDSEDLVDAINMLSKASKKKGAEIAFLIRTRIDSEEEFDLCSDLHKQVIIVDSASCSIENNLFQLLKEKSALLKDNKGA